MGSSLSAGVAQNISRNAIMASLDYIDTNILQVGLAMFCFGVAIITFLALSGLPGPEVIN